VESESREAAVTQEVEDTQVKPVAGIWACPNCGRRIQVIVESDKPKVQPFTCVCGTAMDPGEEHAQIGTDSQTQVVDD